MLNTYFSSTRQRFLLAALVGLLTMLTAGGPLSTPVFAQAASPSATDPVIDVNTQIHVNFPADKDLTADYTVDANGDITMLYVNQIHIGGQTKSQATDTIKKALSPYYTNPQLTITVISLGGINVQISGSVTKQGAMVVRSDTHLNEVMQSSGYTLDADLSQISITHGTGIEQHTTDTVDYLSFLNDKNDAGNPLLRDGDVIFVKKKNQVPIQITLRGEVAKPGPSTVLPTTTVYDAIQAAQGLTLLADKSKIVIVHSNSSQQIPFDYVAAGQHQLDPTVNPLLLDGDVVVVGAASVLQQYYLTGAVNSPGPKQLPQTKWTISDALGQAGGLAPRPQLEKATITRVGAGGKSEVIAINLTDSTVRANTPIEAGDTINIPQGKESRPPLDFFQVIGAIGAVVGLYSVFHH